MPARLEVLVSAIERLGVDAVVNAANCALRPGSGVDGALRHAAGPELTRLTMTMAPIGEGEAVLTPGFNAPARTIIHTAAPIWFDDGDEDKKIAALAACYHNTLMLAQAHAVASIAFPCLGIGNFGWPKELARDTALAACRATLGQTPTIERVIFCCFTQADGELYRAVLD